VVNYGFDFHNGRGRKSFFPKNRKKAKNGFDTHP